MATQFGERIRALRTQQGLLLRELASAMKMDTALLSKIERGLRLIRKEQVSQIARTLNADAKELQTLWLADQVMDVLKGEKLADEALKKVTKNINAKKNSGK